MFQIYFWTYVAIVASESFKTRSGVVSPSSPSLLYRLGVMRGKAEAVPTGVGGPHVLAGGRMWADAGWGQRRGRLDGGLAFGRPGASPRPI